MPRLPHYITHQKMLIDPKRSRPIALETYQPNLENTKLPLIIINHGYQVMYDEYSFLAKQITALGYYVVSIQHELPSDPPFPIKGKSLYEKRKPIWERGIENMFFVIEELKKTEKRIDFSNISLIGHSNGGDMSLFLAAQQPALLQRVIALDNLRMAIPRTFAPKILSIRATDRKADQNVLPTPEEQSLFGIKIITLKGAKHKDLCDRGPEKIKLEISSLIEKFLQGKL